VRWPLGLVLCLLLGGSSFLADAEDLPRVWLGVQVQDGAVGARIVTVYPGYPAELMGLRAGDEVTAIDGRRVHSGQSLAELVMQDHQVGDVVEVSFLRRGVSRKLRVALDTYTDETELFRRRWVGRSAPSDAFGGFEPGGQGPVALLGRVSVFVFIGNDRCRNNGCSALVGALKEFAGDEGITLRVVPPGPLQDLFHITKVPALVVVDRDGWVSFAGAGHLATAQNLRMHTVQALRSQFGLLVE